MSVALALFYFSRVFECVEALPLDIGRRVVQSCDASNDSRTTSDIIWSCLVTIFSCTWVAFHPNIPAPYESSFGIGLRRLCVMIMAVIAPELVIMFAMRQWLVARRLARRHRGKGLDANTWFLRAHGRFYVD